LESTANRHGSTKQNCVVERASRRRHPASGYRSHDPLPTARAGSGAMRRAAQALARHVRCDHADRSG
jgi:hypothetical protein